MKQFIKTLITYLTPSKTGTKPIPNRRAVGLAHEYEVIMNLDKVKAGRSSDLSARIPVFTPFCVLPNKPPYFTSRCPYHSSAKHHKHH